MMMMMMMLLSWTTGMIAAAAAWYQLQYRMDEIYILYTQQYTLNEQVSVFVFIFAIIFVLVSLCYEMANNSNKNSNPSSLSLSPLLMNNNNSNKNKKQQKQLLYNKIEQSMSLVQDDKEKFQCVYEMIKTDILFTMKQSNQLPQEGIEWLQQMMDYNVPGGKLNRGTMVLGVYRALSTSNNQNTEIVRAAILGWTIEFLQAFFLVADDIMDDSQLRRNQPCWYKLHSVQMIAINDSFLLESFVFTILREHFSMESYYYDLIELLLDVIQKTEIGQLLDLTSQPHLNTTTSATTTTTSTTKIDLNRFTLERYQQIVEYKTAYYSFYLPVAMGMLMHHIRDPNAYQMAKKILLIMGEYFQIQDDYLDCYGDPSIIGKVGTDIQDNKCSWLVVQALQRCTMNQRQILENNYGQWDDSKVQKVKDLYNELNLKQVFEQYEESSYQMIQKEMHQIDTNILPKEVFEIFLTKIYKRSL